MTSYSEEYSSTTTIIDEEFDAGGNYPTAFGITFTPQVSGISLGILGLLAMGYVLLNFFMPALGEYQQLKQDEQAKQAQVDQQSPEILMRLLANAEVQLQEAQQRKATVLELYANSEDLNTILYNFNTLFVNRDMKLLSFLPQGEPVVIADDSLGANVNNRLKRQTYTISMAGGFNQTLALIRDIERLQPLILMKNLRTSLVNPEFPVNVVRDGDTVQVQTDASDTLTTDLTLEVFMPLTPEEIAALTPPPPPPGQEGQPPAEGETPPAP
ncbi:pilus assembly protein [Synechocystis salina LEGE 06099]|uniref:pilus assembly protein n=1 Tax=Synechocystis salina TaxID=945780 RepID=UPI0018806D44|nr:pilus assembly protein [Synechocystis salina]MBE9202371.1 pilus assembly protein [Synechocystis salina LEGE 06099]